MLKPWPLGADWSSAEIVDKNELKQEVSVREAAVFIYVIVMTLEMMVYDTFQVVFEMLQFFFLHVLRPAVGVEVMSTHWALVVFYLKRAFKFLVFLIPFWVFMDSFSSFIKWFKVSFFFFFLMGWFNKFEQELFIILPLRLRKILLEKRLPLLLTWTVFCDLLVGLFLKLRVQIWFLDFVYSASTPFIVIGHLFLRDHTGDLEKYQ